ncbi:hypothetical protein GCM10022233_48380 [Streptomyces shaanxiensis]|uniref:Uncharacterized protein n=1 Tax=Streptomyces shaanxiensis TaxID=653357 RepID=A0ABP7VHI0_9ACTN
MVFSPSAADAPADRSDVAARKTAVEAAVPILVLRFLRCMSCPGDEGYGGWITGWREEFRGERAELQGAEG